MPEDAEMVDFDDVLKVLSVSPERLEDLVITGELSAFRRGRAIRFHKKDVADYLVRHGGRGAPAKLGVEDRKAKAVAAKIASLRRSGGEDASALLERLGATGEGPEELISVKERLEGRGAGAAPAEEILVELQKELVAARRKADGLQSEKEKLAGQLQLLDALKEEVKQIAVVARENEELRKKLAGRGGDVEDAQRVAQLARERDRLTEQLKGAEDALSAVQGHASEVSSLRAEKRELEQKLERAREEARASLFVPEDEQVQRAMAHSDELAAERKKLLQEIEALRKQSGKLEARLSAVEAERDGAVRKLKKTEASLKAIPSGDEVKRLEKELEETREQLDSARQDAASELRSENESIKSELSELREKIEVSARAEGQLEELRSEAEKLRAERDELREELRGAQVTLGHMRADSVQVKQRGKETDEARSQIRELQKEHDQISARALVAETTRDEAKKELEGLAARVSELEPEAAAASRAREEAESLRTELGSLKSALEEEKNRAGALEEEKARAQEEREAEVSSLKEEAEKLKAIAEEAKAGAASAEEVESLRAELEEARSRSADLERELQEARAEGEGELEAASRSEEVESLKTDLEEARSRSVELESELEETERQLQEAAASDSGALKSELEAARARSSELERDLEEAKGRLQGAARTKRVKKLVSELEIVRSRAQELEGKLAEAETSSEELDQLREELERATAEKETALSEAEELRTSAGGGEELRGRLDELSAQLAEAREASDSHRLELSRKEGALAALQAQLERARNSEEEAKGLTGQLAELREKFARAQAELGPVRKERDGLAAKLRAGAPPEPAPRRATGITLGGGPLPPDAPKRVGRFTLLGLIGVGRKGWVCLASSPYAAGVAAVRILSEGLVGDVRFMDQFVPRIRRVAELENKSIVDVLDTGEFPGGYFVAMELVEGGTLRERLDASDRINPDETLAIIMQLTKALEVARRAGLVHRDIRPENILFTQDGTPKLSDLGLSLGTAEDGCSTGKGWARRYAAPEQVHGGKIDCRADVFSLGAVAHEMLTGRAAFQAATSRGAAKLYESTVLDRPDCPPGFALAITRMLCKSPDDRYASPKDLATDLILLSDGREPKASAPEGEQSFVRPP